MRRLAVANGPNIFQMLLVKNRTKLSDILLDFRAPELRTVKNFADCRKCCQLSSSDDRCPIITLSVQFCVYNTTGVTQRVARVRLQQPRLFIIQLSAYFCILPNRVSV